MRLTRIRFTNFKSFESIDLSLGAFTAIIGANAAGKSNLLQVFKFLSDIAKHGLDNAISMQGGVEYLRNFTLGCTKDLEIQISMDGPEIYGLISPVEDMRLVPKGYDYSFSIRFLKDRIGFRVAHDELTIRCLAINERAKEPNNVLGEGTVTLRKIRGSLQATADFPDGVIPDKARIMNYPKGLSPKNLLLEGYSMYGFLYVVPPIDETFGNISVYDFDPRLAKKAVPITGKVDLEEDGGNLAIALKRVIEEPKQRARFYALVQDLLPFVQDVDVKSIVDKSLLFSLRESYWRGYTLPASLLSDGTINVTAVLIALWFESKPLIVIEEPERNIHPHLIARLIEMMRDASERRQVIITTQSPEVVRAVKPKELLLVSRDQQGFSRVTKPAQRDDVKTFLQNEIGIDELYIQNLLERD